MPKALMRRKEQLFSLGILGRDFVIMLRGSEKLGGDKLADGADDMLLVG